MRVSFQFKKHKLNRLVLAALLLFLAICPLTFGKDGNVNSLVGNPLISLYVETERGVPQYVSGKLAEAVNPGGKVSRTVAYFDEHKNAYKMSDPQKELVVKRVEEDKFGNHHLRFDQYYKGLKVIEGNLISHFNRDGELKTVNGFYQAEINLDVKPAVSPFEAIDIAAADLAENFGPAAPQQPELVVFPWLGEYFLCWHLFLLSDYPLGRWEYFIDAHSGEIIFKFNRIKGGEEIGTGTSVLGLPRNHIDVWYTGDTYEMRDYTRQLNNNIHGHNGQMPDGNYIQTNIAEFDLPGTIAVDEDNIWAGEDSLLPAVDAHVYTGLFYDWALREFGRNSYDNNGASMISSVNYFIDSNSAWWIGDQTVYMTWQSGTRSFAACLDVVGHEWAHGITEYTSDLVYRWETGAVDESFSDITGTAFEFAHDTLDSPDWNIGENSQVYGNGYSSLSNPGMYGQPSIYQGTYWYNTDNCIPSFANDFCGVHTNCGVGNKWFYLLSAGGYFNGVLVNGIDIENAIKIIYHANAYYYTQTSDYLDAAIGTYYAAMDIDPSGAWAAEVLNAWLAVGVEVPGIGLSFEFPLGNPRTIQRKQTTQVEVEVSGIVNGVPVPGTGQIHYTVDGGELITEAMTEISDNHYQATLPGLSCEQNLKYYFSAQEEGGERFYHPEPASSFSPIVVDSVPVLFDDDFESDRGWSVYGNAAEGHWERGMPVEGNGGPDTDYDGTGQCFLTGNAEGDSDVDNGISNLVSPTFDLDGTDGIVRFATWYDVRCESGPGEVMNIYISNNDGYTWRLATFLGPQLYAHGGWFEHEFVVSDIITPTANMKLRFEAADIGWPSCVEAAVDAVEITKFVCQIYICGDASNDGIVNILDATFLISHLYKDGPPPTIPAACDVNGDGNINLLDITYLIAFLYKDGPEPNCL